MQFTEIVLQYLYKHKLTFPTDSVRPMQLEDSRPEPPSPGSLVQCREPFSALQKLSSALGPQSPHWLSRDRLAQSDSQLFAARILLAKRHIHKLHVHL